MIFRSSLMMVAALGLSLSVHGGDELKPVEVGDRAPDFAVMGIDGEEFKLSERLGDGERNVVLLFSRAHW